MIEIKITAETPAEALKDLTELTAKLAAGIAPVAEEKPKKTKPAPAEAPAKDEAPPWEGKKETPAEPPAPSYTLETIRAAGVAAATAHGKDTVKAVLTSLGVSGMTQLTPEQYPAFMGKLGELDA